MQKAPFLPLAKSDRELAWGLSIVYGIITEHGGNIRAENKPGNGAVFIIELPSIILNN
ncbi:MAG: ATP-binding protein [Limnochordia bacterium]|nr:ATP-binding protein [Limnochordia bacterium]MDD5605619.1 ATP-binding protein [Dehalococcoidales bacterium]